jgi:hypothetical protein
VIRATARAIAKVKRICFACVMKDSFWTLLDADENSVWPSQR